MWVAVVVDPCLMSLLLASTPFTANSRWSVLYVCSISQQTTLSTSTLAIHHPPSSWRHRPQRHLCPHPTTHQPHRPSLSLDIIYSHVLLPWTFSRTQNVSSVNPPSSTQPSQSSQYYQVLCIVNRCLMESTHASSPLVLINCIALKTKSKHQSLRIRSHPTLHCLHCDPLFNIPSLHWFTTLSTQSIKINLLNGIDWMTIPHLLEVHWGTCSTVSDNKRLSSLHHQYRWLSAVYELHSNTLDTL